MFRIKEALKQLKAFKLGAVLGALWVIIDSP